MARSKTIIITGGAGQLGSRTAIALETAYPSVYHIILTARSPNDSLDAEFGSAGVDFSWEAMDLSSFASVNAFIQRVNGRLTNGDLKGSRLAGIINSAALSMYSRGKKTADGFDPVYEINVLGGTLLTIGLLEMVSDGGVVVNVSSSAHALGRANYFWDEKIEKDWAEQEEKTKIGLKEGLTRYGSSKLLALMVGFKLQHDLDVKSPSRHIQIVSLDPGGMGGESRLGEQHWILGAMTPVLSALGPLVRLIDPSSFNEAKVPAKSIAGLFFHEGKTDGGVAGKYFVLSKETAASQLSQNVTEQQVVWDHVLRDLGLDEQQLLF